MSAFGRVDSDLNVYLFDGDSERKVGQYLLGSADEALAFFESKFAEFLSKVLLLEQRAASGRANAKTLVTSLNALVGELQNLNAVGDFAAARKRLEAISAKLSEKAAVEEAANADLRKDLLAKKESIATQAEAIAARQNPNFKKSGAEMDLLFASWQELQKSPVKVSKSETDPIWRRFSSARKSFETARRSYFSQLDQQNKSARAERQAIVKQAEALDSDSPSALSNYRELLDKWKALGKNGNNDEGLWLRLKAVGDRVFAAKKAKDAAEEEEFKGNLDAKLALLTEADKIDFSDVANAREQFRSIQARWSQIGKVPRAQLAKVNDRWDRLRKQLADAEAKDWKRTDTAALDRSNALTTQLEAAIAELEQQLAAASPKDRPEIESQLAVRKSWLDAARAAVA